MIQSDNGGEFSSREFKQFLLKQNIDQKLGPPYRPKCQGAVESLHKTVQKLLEITKYHKKDKYNLEDFVNDFLIYYYNRKHSTTEIAPYVIMRNVNDQELIQKIITKTEKTRNKIKRTIDNNEKRQIVRIINHIQHLKNSDYIIYKPPIGLQKGINKEVLETKAIVLNNRTNHCKVQVIETTHEDDMFKRDSIWKVDKDASEKVQ